MRVNTLSRDVFHWKFHHARLNLNDFSIQIFKLRAHTIVVKHSKIEFYQQRRFAYNKIIFHSRFRIDDEISSAYFDDCSKKFSSNCISLSFRILSLLLLPSTFFISVVGRLRRRLTKIVCDIADENRKSQQKLSIGFSEEKKRRKKVT